MKLNVNANISLDVAVSRMGGPFRGCPYNKMRTTSGSMSMFRPLIFGSFHVSRVL